jgi:hypothetical protein
MKKMLAKPAKRTKRKKVRDLQLYTAAAKIKGGARGNTTMATARRASSPQSRRPAYTTRCDRWRRG